MGAAQFSSDSQLITGTNEPTACLERSVDYENIIAAALSAAFGEKVVTKQEYDRRKNEPEFGNAETLDLRRYEKMCYEPVQLEYGDEFGKDGDPLTVTITVKNNFPEQLSYKLSVGDKSYVKELKFLFEEKLGIPVDHSRLIFTFKEVAFQGEGKELEDESRVSDYRPVRVTSIIEKGCVHLISTLF